MAARDLEPVVLGNSTVNCRPAYGLEIQERLKRIVLSSASDRKPVPSLVGRVQEQGDKTKNGVPSNRKEETQRGVESSSYVHSNPSNDDNRRLTTH